MPSKTKNDGESGAGRDREDIAHYISVSELHLYRGRQSIRWRKNIDLRRADVVNVRWLAVNSHADPVQTGRHQPCSEVGIPPDACVGRERSALISTQVLGASSGVSPNAFATREMVGGAMPVILTR